MSKSQRKVDAFDGSHLLICRKRCDQCLFSANKIVSDQRKKQLLRDCRRNGTYFICHKSKQSTPVVCRGFFDNVYNQLCQVAVRLGLTRMVDPDNPYAESQPKKSE